MIWYDCILYKNIVLILETLEWIWMVALELTETVGEVLLHR